MGRDGDEFAAHDLKADAFEDVDAFTTEWKTFSDVAYVHDDGHIYISLLS